MEKTHNRQQTVYGLRPVIEAIDGGVQIDRIYLQNGIGGQLASELKSRIREHNIPFQYVPAEKLNKMTGADHRQGGTNHQGVVATIANVKYRSLTELLEETDIESKPLLVMLDHVTDVRNMGAIARTAECTGATALIVPDHGSAAINEDAIKTSSGALLRLPVCREQNLKTAINLAKQYGYQVVASTEKGTTHYREVDFSKATVLIMGNEESGISPELLRLSDVRASLPIVGEVASLNVSVAAGVMMYEALEQKEIRR